MKTLTCILLLLSLGTQARAQGVKIGTDTGSPDPAAILEMQSTTQGLLPPRMNTAERDAIENPPPGLRIYNTDTGCENFFSGYTNHWMAVCGVCPGPPAPLEDVHTPSGDQIEWHWTAVNGATGYKYNTSNDYASAVDAGNTTTYTQTGLSYDTPSVLYVWAYNLCGASASPVTMTSSTTPNPCIVGAIGPGGGYVFYCGNAYPGFIGLEAAPGDQSSGAPWGCEGTPITGADGTGPGTGKQNTLDIINGCGTPGIAARLCDDLVQSGYNDWFLPSQWEAQRMFIDLHVQGLGGFTSSFYWTSTEQNSTTAWYQDFADGGLAHPKSSNYRVRCVRAF